MHVVHYSDRFQKIDDAIDKPDGLMVLGFFFEVYLVIFVNLPVFSIYRCMHFFLFHFHSMCSVVDTLGLFCPSSCVVTPNRMNILI